MTRRRAIGIFSGLKSNLLTRGVREKKEYPVFSPPWCFLSFSFCIFVCYESDMKNFSRGTLLVFLFLHFFFRSDAQKLNVDSLATLLAKLPPIEKKELPNAKDTMRLSILNQLILNTEDEKMQEYEKEFETILEQKYPEVEKISSVFLKERFKRYYAVYLNNKAVAFYYAENNKAAIDAWTKSYEIFTHFKEKESMVGTLVCIGKVFEREGKYDLALEKYLECLALYKELNDKNGLAEVNHSLGDAYAFKGDLVKGIEHYLESIRLHEEIGGETGIASGLNNLAMVYMKQGDIPKALDYFHKSLKLQQKIKSKPGESSAYNNIGAIYESQGDLAGALDYFKKSARIREEINDKRGLAATLSNMGVVYHKMDLKANGSAHAKEASELFFKALKIREEIEDREGQAHTLDHIARFYEYHGKRDLALTYFQKGLDFRRELKSQPAIASSLCNIGDLYYKQQDLKKALEYGEQSLKIQRNYNFPSQLSAVAALMYKVYKAVGRKKEALEMHELYIQMRDSVSNQETRKSSLRKQFQYEYESKEAEVKAIAKAEKEKLELKALEDRKRQTLIIYSVLAGLILVSVFSLFIFKSLQENKKANKIISAQKKEVERQKHIVDEKQKEILDSIQYAKRIQNALMANEKYIGKNLDRLQKG